MARKPNKLLCCHLSHEMTETLLTFQEPKDIPFSPSVRKRRKRRGKKKAFEWLFIQFSIASLDFLSRKHRSEGSTSVSTVKTDVTSHCSAGTGELQTQRQSSLEGVGVGRADPQHSTNCSTRATLPPPHNSSRVHSPLPILISLPLAKESPQFPLPPRAAAFIFFQVVNYNSRAKSTVNFYSLPKQFNIPQAFVSVVQLPKKYSLHLPPLSLHSVFQQAHTILHTT